MGEYGYSYERYSYNTAGGGRLEEPFPSLIKKPLGPFVPNFSNSNSDSHFPRGKQVPVTFSDSSNRNSESHVPRRKQVPVTTGSYPDEYRHSSPKKVYPARHDDYERNRWTSPVHGRPEFFTKVQNEASRPAGFNPPTTDWRQRPHTYDNGANGYGDYGGRNENRKHKPIVRSDSYDDYHPDNGYGGNKPIVRSDSYDDNHENRYGRVFPKSKSPTNGFDNFSRDNGYGGNYGNKEGHQQMGSPVRNDTYDYGEPKKPTFGGGWNRPIWTAPPKQGTQLTSPTSDISMAIELLKNLGGSPKATANDHPNDKYDNFRGRNNGLDRPTKESERVKPLTTVGPPNSSYKPIEPSYRVGKVMEPPVKEPEKIKNVLTAPPPQPRTVPVESTTSSKYDNREDTKPRGSFNFASPRRNIIDGRDEADQRENNRGGQRRFGDSRTIDSKQAARDCNGSLF